MVRSIEIEFKSLRLMRTATLCLNGFTLGTPPMSTKHKKSPRGDVYGWSKGSTRRNVSFLRSVDTPKLHVDGYTGWSVTLTVKDCPKTSDEWQSLRTSFIHRLRRLGLLRMHWVLEWQRRGVPHLHAAVWLPSDVPFSKIIDHWLDLTFYLGTKRVSQYVKPITDALGWFRYTAKHTARGAAHYQRSPASIPAGWKKTGNVWRSLGDWPIYESTKFELCDSSFYRMRRMSRSWRIADARNSARSALRAHFESNPLDKILYNQSDHKLRTLMFKTICRKSLRRVKSARSMLKFNDRNLSDVRGISEWIPKPITIRILDFISMSGGHIEC